MVDVLSTASSFVTLLGTAITLVRQVQKARESVKGTSKTLDNITRQLSTLVSTLSLVKEQDRLQTASVGQQLQAIIEIAEELKAFFDKTKAGQQRIPIRQFFNAFKSGGKGSRELADIFDRLDRARLELVLRISLAHVGLVGNLQDGFRVILSVLQETNADVKRILGRDLYLATWVNGRQDRQTDGTIPLDPADVKALGLSTTPKTTTNNVTVTNSISTTIVDNVTIGQARIMTGDIGVDRWQNRVTRKTEIAKNKFGGDVRIMTGDISGRPAATFNERFWN